MSRQEQNGARGCSSTTADADQTKVRAVPEGITSQCQPAVLFARAESTVNEGELRFSGFEPCYIACIEDLETQIQQKIQALNFRDASAAGPAKDMAPLLLQYAQLIEALANIESKSRVFEEDWKDDTGMFANKDRVSRYSGIKRRIDTTKQDDKVHKALRQNIFLVILGYLYGWDTADSLRHRFGNLTQFMNLLILSIGSAASLLVPAIMMTYLRTNAARVAISCVATIVFAIFICCAKVSKEAVFSAVAAYAAVMVVYLGSSSTGGAQ